jgi:hypothetical protein
LRTWDKICAIFGSFPREFPVFLVVETPFWRCSGNLDTEQKKSATGERL